MRLRRSAAAANANASSSKLKKEPSLAGEIGSTLKKALDKVSGDVDNNNDDGSGGENAEEEEDPTDPLDLRAAIKEHWHRSGVSFICTLNVGGGDGGSNNSNLSFSTANGGVDEAALLGDFFGPEQSVPCSAVALRGLVRPQHILGAGLPRTIHCSAVGAPTIGGNNNNREASPTTTTTTFEASIFGGVPGFLAKYAMLVEELRKSNILFNNAPATAASPPYGGADDVIHIQDDGTVKTLLQRLGDAFGCK